VAARRHAIRDITDALAGEALTELPVHRFRLEKIAAAHGAAEGRALGKVVIDLT
jgi:NADPH2:quinone reductase